jgi:hypothetical protein
VYHDIKQWWMLDAGECESNSTKYFWKSIFFLNFVFTFVSVLNNIKFYLRENSWILSRKRSWKKEQGYVVINWYMGALVAFP